MALPNTLKVTIVGGRGIHRDHLMQYNIHRYNQKDHEQLLERILRRTGQRDFEWLRLFWEDSEHDRISVTTYRDMKNYLDACLSIGRPCEVFVSRLSRKKIFWKSVRRAVQRYGRVYFKWV